MKYILVFLPQSCAHCHSLYLICIILISILLLVIIRELLSFCQIKSSIPLTVYIFDFNKLVSVAKRSSSFNAFLPLFFSLFCAPLKSSSLSSAMNWTNLSKNTACESIPMSHSVDSRMNVPYIGFQQLFPGT